jgi:hypothetical protein
MGAVGACAFLVTRLSLVVAGAERLLRSRDFPDKLAAWRLDRAVIRR